MSQEVNTNEHKDFTGNWVTSSRFLFYTHIFCIMAFVLGGCFQMYKARYKGTPELEVPESTQYTPKYK